MASTIVEDAPLAGAKLAVDDRDGKTGFKFLRADRLLSYVILACGLLTVSVGARQIVTSHSLVPMWDEWQEIDAIATAPHHHPPISWLWSLHNEHRVVVYRLLLLADIHIFHGKHWISFWSMLAVQSLFLVALAWMLHFAGVRGTIWRTVVGLGAFSLFCPSQWENFGWAFQISFLLPGLLLMLALSALLKYERSVRQLCPRWIYLGLSLVAASVATYSNANGVVLWPLLLLVAIALVPRPEVLLSYAGFGLVLIGSYLHNYAGPSIHSSPLNSIRHPLPISEYMAGYLGVIFPAWVRIRDVLAVSSGLSGLVMALAVTVWVLTRQRREPLQMALLGLMFFTVSTAFITALGRIGFGLAQAFASRYQTFNLLFWFSTVSLLLLLAEEVNSSLRTVILAAIAATMLLAFAVFPLGLNASRTRTEQAEAAATALLAGVPDKQALGVLFEDSFLVWRDADYFRQQRLFMFSDVKNNQMGQLLSSIYRVGSSQQCQGQATVVERVPSEDLLFDRDAGALRISGWAMNGPSKTPVSRLIIAADGKVIGFAASIAGPFTAKHSDLVRKSESGDWLGFARPPHGTAVFDVYAVDNSAGSLCHLAAVEVPQQ
jgi:hypothetical protein